LIESVGGTGFRAFSDKYVTCAPTEPGLITVIGNKIIKNAGPAEVLFVKWRDPFILHHTTAAF
jgi:hypothetical protein